MLYMNFYEMFVDKHLISFNARFFTNVDKNEYENFFSSTNRLICYI